MTEQDIHKAIVAYLNAVLPPDAILTHAPNEGNRGGAKGARDGERRKAMGVLAGFPDLLLFVDGTGYCIEVKTPQGRLSPVQKRVRDILRGQGIAYEVARSVDDVRALLAEWGVRTREARHA